MTELEEAERLGGGAPFPLRRVVVPAFLLLDAFLTGRKAPALGGVPHCTCSHEVSSQDPHLHGLAEQTWGLPHSAPSCGWVQGGGRLGGREQPLCRSE